MGMVIDSGFANQTITFLTKTTSIDPVTHTTQTVWTDKNSYKSCVYSKSLGMGYFDSGLWKEDTLYVAMIDYTSDTLLVTDRIRFNGVIYAIDYIDDVAFQHEAIFIGLKAVK